MSTIADIAKLLEQIPIWKRIKELPGRVEVLEGRLAALEKAIELRPSAEQCPICGTGTLKTTKITAHPTMGAVGLQEKHLLCDNKACGHTEKRMHDPLERTKK